MTDRRRLSGGAAHPDAARRCLVQQVTHAIDAGVDVIQVRERDLEGATLATLVSELVELARGSATRVVVNDRLDVAIACGAAGAHLRADSVPAAAARAAAPAGFIIGRSVHTVSEAEEAAASVDYLIAGTVWPTESKGADHAVIGTTGLARIVSAVRVPVLGIGGLTVRRLPSIARTGAAGAACIGLFMTPEGGGGCRAQALETIVAAARMAFELSGSAS